MEIGAYFVYRIQQFATQIANIPQTKSYEILSLSIGIYMLDAITDTFGH